MGIKTIPDECSNCGGEIDDLGYQCPNCGASLCSGCICLCGIEVKSEAIEKAFKIVEDNKVTNIDTSIEEEKKKGDFILKEGDDEWIEIKNISVVKENEDTDIYL